MSLSNALRSTIILMLCASGWSCGGAESESDIQAENCPNPVGMRLTLGSQNYCGLALTDMRDFRVFTDTANEIWTAERTVGDEFQFTEGQFNRFDGNACRTTVISQFERSFRNQENVQVQVEISYDLQLGASEVFGLAQVRVVCDPAGACGAAYVAGECLFTANVDGSVYCTGEDCQPLGQTNNSIDGGTAGMTGATDAGMETDMGSPEITVCPQIDRIEDEKGTTWVCIEGGSFTMGDDGERRTSPTHDVTVPTFWMAQSEVTVAQYSACSDCGRPQNSSNFGGPGAQPINGLTMGEMTTYINWVNSVLGNGHRLPSESEWEFAATSRGTELLPWGMAEPTCDDVQASECGLETTPVCSKPGGHTVQGLCDMLGNLAEVLEDDYHATYDCADDSTADGCNEASTAESQTAPTDGSPWINPAPRGNLRVKRGGSYNFSFQQISAKSRSSVDNMNNSRSDLGFRMARAIAPAGRDVSCGNGEVNTTESCDDGNRENGDGCSDRCVLEEDAQGGSAGEGGSAGVGGSGEAGNTGEGGNAGTGGSAGAGGASGDEAGNSGEAGSAGTGGNDGQGGNLGGGSSVPNIDFVTIEPGNFTLGDQSLDYGRQLVDIDEFEMSVTEVTVAQYRQCVDASICTEPNCTASTTATTSDVQWVGSCNYAQGRENHPVNYVDHGQAKTFAEWVGGRLPSEAEWEYAASSADSGGARGPYPWGTQEPGMNCMYANWRCSQVGTAPVGNSGSGRTASGLQDMAGNVWEWCADEYEATYSNERDDGSAFGNLDGRDRFGALRGGAWRSVGPASLWVKERGRQRRDAPSDDIGFRVARSIPTNPCQDLADDGAVADGQYDVAIGGITQSVYCKFVNDNEGWLRVYAFDLAAGDNCPTEWPRNSNYDACARDNDDIDSLLIENIPFRYSSVMGNAKLYQVGSTNGFDSPSESINVHYMDGVSITQNNEQGQRTHLFSYALALSRNANVVESGNQTGLCPDIGGRSAPNFLEGNYSCDSGNNGSVGAERFADAIFANDTWETTVAPSQDDIELRIMLNEARDNEDVLVEKLEIYIR